MTVDDDGSVFQHSALGELQFIASGGQGRVFRCVDARLVDVPGPLVYKEY